MVSVIILVIIIIAMIIIFYHKSWKMYPFLLLMGEQRSGEAHGGQFGILESMLWSTAENPEDIDWNSWDEWQASSPSWKTLECWDWLGSPAPSVLSLSSPVITTIIVTEVPFIDFLPYICKDFICIIFNQRRKSDLQARCYPNLQLCKSHLARG